MVLCLIALFLLWLFVLRGNTKPGSPSEVATQLFTGGVPASIPVAVAPVQPHPASAVVAPTTAKPIMDTEPIASAIGVWADAWARQDVSAYLVCYAPTFNPAQEVPLAVWREQRATRISQAKSIKISLSDMHIDVIDTEHATARFRQEYTARAMRDSTHKTLRLVKQGERWLIEQELSVPQ
jgi:hypothetical protein